VDFVNLRHEKYTETSRVPEIEIGTPEEDAYRRDLTINAMFYNINT
jgi:tRNA nucleotidyltransferase (CCA-adding enzyme)